MRVEVQAFANKVPSGKTFIFSLQKSIKHLSLLKHFGRQCLKTALGKAPKRYTQQILPPSLLPCIFNLCHIVFQKNIR